MRMFLHRNSFIGKFLLLLPFVVFFACTNSVQTQLVYVGTYTGNGSEGIYAYRFNPENGKLNPIGLVAKTDNPSFITIDSAGQFLYAVNEVDSFQNQYTGALSVYKINKESGDLQFLQQIPSLGAAPAHLSLDKSGRYLLCANYNGGNIAVFPIGDDGRLGSHTAFVQDTGSSINPERQAGPHAHFIKATNDNKFVAVADLGIDKVLIFQFDTSNGSLKPCDFGLKLEPGSGPRHLAFAPSEKFIYVLNELSSTISVFSFELETGMMQPLQSLSTLPDDFSVKNTSAEIVIDTKGRFLYISNRGADNIGLFRISPKDGSLEAVEWISSGGQTPRNFEIDPSGQWLLAANQESGNIAIFRIDSDNGKLKQISDSTKIVSPVCISFLVVQ